MEKKSKTLAEELEEAEPMDAELVKNALREFAEKMDKAIAKSR